MYSRFVNHKCSSRVRIRDFARPGTDNPPRQGGRVAGAQHRGQRLFARRAVGLGRANGPIRLRSAKRKAAVQAPSSAAARASAPSSSSIPAARSAAPTRRAP